MFEVANRRTKGRTALQLIELIFFWTQRSITGSSRNPGIALLSTIIESVVMIAAFYFVLSAIGMRKSTPIQGDMITFLASGIFLFLTHNKTVMSVSGAEGPTSPMMQHAPMNTAVAIISAALATLYKQLLAVILLLFCYDLITDNVKIHDPVGALAMFLLAWWTGACIGLFFRAIKLVQPKVSSVAMMGYRRANMIFSGKMSPANALPATMLPMFDWNPLFHIIDAARGCVFVNYTAYRVSPSYAVYATFGLFVIGLLGDFYTRQSMQTSRTD